MKIIISILFVLLAYPSKAQLSLISADPLNEYYIYHINGHYLSVGKVGAILILGKKNIKKGKQYFPESKWYNFWHNFWSFPSSKGKLPNGATFKRFRGSCNKVDTIIYNNIILKYPMEINNASNFLPNDLSVPILIDSFRIVDSCGSNSSKHFEFFTTIQ